jgi:GH15 family glucan-1,4-alpha-glucosidase
MENLNFGVIGNCRTAALVSRVGSIDWCCFPDFDSPSVFAKILDQRRGGHFGFKVADNYVITQRYMPHTNILITSFESPDSAFEVYDFMPRYKTGDIKGYYLPAEIYRLIRYRKGKPKFYVDFKPAANYARDLTTFEFKKKYLKICSVENDIDSIYLYSSFNKEEIL